MKFIGPVSSLSRIVLSAIGFWFLMLILLFVFPNLLPTISSIAGLLSLPVVLVLLILALIALIRDKFKLLPALSVVLIPLVLYLAIFHLIYWGALVNFYLNKSYYETTAKSMIAAQSEDERRQICGERCGMMSTNPPRVLFRHMHSFLVWDDIVYDPSGALVKPMTSEERFRISQYFQNAKHLSGDWYLVRQAD